jgi:predicted enzyme related to lactoylglutathione lyase
MSFENVLASMAVKDLRKATQWYESVLGRAPDATPMKEIAEWKFDGGGGLQIYLLPERAGDGSCTLVISNLGEHIAKLDKLGIDTRQKTTSAKVDTVMITDPDGNHLAFAEAHGSVFTH